MSSLLLKSAALALYAFFASGSVTVTGTTAQPDVSQLEPMRVDVGYYAGDTNGYYRTFFYSGQEFDWSKDNGWWELNFVFQAYKDNIYTRTHDGTFFRTYCVCVMTSPTWRADLFVLPTKNETTGAVFDLATHTCAKSPLIDSMGCEAAESKKK
jgi:hypothetical protein